MISNPYLGLLFLLCISAPVAAAVFGSDDRRPVSVLESSPYRPIGIVFRPNKSHYATGFLVDRCTVLTVKHVVDDVASATDRILYFRVGPNTIRSKSSSKGRVIAAGNFNLETSANDPGQGRHRDWLLLRLDRCLGDEFGYLSLAAIAPKIGQPLASIGFPRDRSLNSPTIDPNCQVRAVVGKSVLHDCASRQGSSGGPIVRRVERDGEIVVEVLAMHSAGVPDRGVRSFDYAYSSIAVPIPAILSAIEPHLDRRDSTRG